MSQEAGLTAHLWTCPLCSGKFHNGWKRHRHVKTCNARLYNSLFEQAEPWTKGSATGQEDETAPRDDMKREDNEGHSHATTDEIDGQEFTSLVANQQKALCNREQLAYEDKGTPYNQYNARHRNITPKDMEILLFLQCNDLGVGSSREHKQGVLDYVKTFDTARTQLLPKTIPTCYNRMDKVTIVHIFTPFGPIL